MYQRMDALDSRGDTSICGIKIKAQGAIMFS